MLRNTWQDPKKLFLTLINDDFIFLAVCRLARKFIWLLVFDVRWEEEKKTHEANNNKRDFLKVKT